jgi:hypothetical protein
MSWALNKQLSVIVSCSVLNAGTGSIHYITQSRNKSSSYLKCWSATQQSTWPRNQNHDDQQETFLVLCSKKQTDTRTVTRTKAESRTSDLWRLWLWECYRKPSTQTDKKFNRHNWGRASSWNQTNINQTNQTNWGRASTLFWRRTRSTSRI